MDNDRPALPRRQRQHPERRRRLREGPMKQLVRIFGLLLSSVCLIAVVPPAEAQQNPKLYVFTSGSLGGFPKAALQIGGKGNIDWAPASFYVITHPKGNIIFDTGI